MDIICKENYNKIIIIRSNDNDFNNWANMKYSKNITSYHSMFYIERTGFEDHVILIKYENDIKNVEIYAGSFEVALETAKNHIDKMYKSYMKYVEAQEKIKSNHPEIQWYKEPVEGEKKGFWRRLFCRG